MQWKIAADQFACRKIFSFSPGGYMQIAERMSKIRPSMTMAISAKAQEMKAAGIPVISLAVGEPDFHTPQFVKEAAKKAIDENFTKYTPVAGIRELREAAGNYFRRNYATPVSSDNVIIGAGGKQCIYEFIQTTVNPGDEVVIPAPYWVSYPDMVLLADARPIFIETDIANGFKITPASLDKVLTPKTRLLILTTPSNPTGAVYSKSELAVVAEWCLKHKIFVLSDEIYDQLVYPPAKMASVIEWFKKEPEWFAVVNGLSKSFAMTGWRMGFLAAHEHIIAKMTQMQGHSLSNISSITQKAALAALEGPFEEVKIMAARFEKRRDLAMDLIGQWKKARCPRADGAFYLFVDVSAYYNGKLSGSLEFCAWLLEKAQVATVPGIAFGDDKCMRLSFATSEENLSEGLEKIEAALELLERD